MAAYKYPYDNEEEKVYVPPKLKTNRNIWKFIIFSVLTLGIYSIAFFIPFSFDIDKIAPKPDRSKTMNYLIAFLLAWFTFSFILFFWHYTIANRVEEALAIRDIDYDFGTKNFWGWYVFGSLILVGPFIYIHKLCKAMNHLSEDYNNRPVI